MSISLMTSAYAFHPIFHVLLLEKYPGDPQDSRPGPIEVGDHEEW